MNEQKENKLLWKEFRDLQDFENSAKGNVSNYERTKEIIFSILDINPNIKFLNLRKELSEKEKSLNFISNVDDSSLRSMYKSYLKQYKIDTESLIRNFCKTKDGLILCRFYGNSFHEENGKQYVLKCLILSSDFHFLRLKFSENILTDGTFRITPYPFKQLLILSAWDIQTTMHIPVAYILLNSKKQFAYLHAFNVLLNHVKEVFERNKEKVTLSIKTVCSDLEKGLMNTLKALFPQCQLKSDKFHFLKKNYAKGVEIGLGTKKNKTILWAITKKLSTYHYLEKKSEFVNNFKNFKKMILEDEVPKFEVLKNKTMQFENSEKLKTKLKKFFNYYERYSLPLYITGKYSF